jgi:hypothetical protein
MQERHKLIGPVDHLTNAEITSAIHYLDPDTSCKRTGNNAGVVLWPILVVLAGVLVYIWLNLRTS